MHSKRNPKDDFNLTHTFKLGQDEIVYNSISFCLFTPFISETKMCTNFWGTGGPSPTKGCQVEKVTGVMEGL